MKKCRRVLFLSFGAAVAAGLIAAGVPAHQAVAAPAPIRLGFLGTDVSSGPLYARESGAFARAGLNVNLQPFRKAFGPLDAMRAGKLDIGFSDIISAVGAIERGEPVVILAPAAIYDARAPITVLLGPKNRHIHSGKDLNGKTLGVPAPHDLGELATRYWIDRHGGDNRTVHYTHAIVFTEIGTALNDGRLDAAEMSEPIKTEIAPRTSFVANTFDDIAPQFVIGVFVARTAWVKAHPAEAKRFTRAMTEAARWANAHHAQTAQILARRYHIPPAVVVKMVRARYPEDLTAKLVQPVIDVGARYGAFARVDAATLLP